MSLRPVDVPPAIRSAPSARPVSAEELQKLQEALRALPYEAYLRTPWWRARRNHALKVAGYRCQRCTAKRELEVHHRSYERIGAELDEDLEVVCRGCHEGHHFNETQDGIAVYVRVVSEVLRDFAADAHFSDIVEAAKCRCAALRIPYHGDRLHAAIARLVPRFPFNPPGYDAALYRVAAPSAPLSRAEAAGALARMSAAGLMKHMPNARPRTLREVEHHKAARILAQAIVWQVQRCDEAERAVEEAANPMKTWLTANRQMRCGYDETHTIAKGDTFLEIEEGGRRRVRCSRCAKRHEPPVPVAAQEATPMTDLPPNPYGLTTGPTKLWGRSRATGIWITPWVAYGRPVILDTSRLGSEFDSRSKEYRRPDAQTLDRYAGRDRMPDDALLVLIHPQMYRDLRQRTDIMDRTGPDVAAEMIDDVCRLEPGLAARMNWTYDEQQTPDPVVEPEPDPDPVVETEGDPW